MNSTEIYKVLRTNTIRTEYHTIERPNVVHNFDSMMQTN